jgi:ubiquinone/menaquinone biosynthesis C-methylase UbiE
MQLFRVRKNVVNQEVCRSQSTIQSYIRFSGLMKPEKTIFNYLKRLLTTMNMLDIGVGGGRTTQYFAPIAKSYVGVDYSIEMICLSKQRFRRYHHKLCFSVADARSLPFENAFFDFVFFSFNGIDCVEYKDRSKVISEVWRVTKNGGYFCFSAHNLNSVNWFVSFHPTLYPKSLLSEIRRIISMRYYNRNIWKKLKTFPEKNDFLTFKDGAENFRLMLCYVNPSKQIEQLELHGFSDIKIFGLSDGQEIKDKTKLDSRTDYYLHYLCRKT